MEIQELRQMIDNGEFNNKPYPRRPNLQEDVEYFLEDFVGTKKQYEQKFEQEKRNILNEYKKEVDKWHKHSNELEESFKQAVFQALEIEKNLKAELLFQKAWEKGHGNGLHDVLSEAIDLVELIK